MKKLTPFSGVIGGAALAAPLVVAAQTLTSILENIGDLINLAVVLVISLGVLFFVWGLVQYITKSGDAEGQTAARNIMIWGVIILFVAVSVWGLVQVLSDTFNVDRGTFETPETSSEFD